MPPTQVLDPVVKDNEENIDIVDVADTSLKEPEPLDVLADNGLGYHPIAHLMLEVQEHQSLLP